MIINVRGTHGSGKTTVIRKVMKKYSAVPESCKENGRPYGYQMDSPFGTIYVVGQYETECGGCDSIQPYADIWPRVCEYAERGHVLFEGALVSNSYGNIGRYSEKYGDDFVFAFLDTPLETCIERIRQRRIAKGNIKPFDPNKSVVRIYNSNLRVIEKVKEHNRRYVVLNHLRPLSKLLGLLNACRGTS